MTAVVLISKEENIVDGIMKLGILDYDFTFKACILYHGDVFVNSVYYDKTPW